MPGVVGVRKIDSELWTQQKSEKEGESFIG